MSARLHLICSLATTDELEQFFSAYHPFNFDYIEVNVLNL